MSGDPGERRERLLERLGEHNLGGRTVRFLFGDRRGLALFLGSLCFIGLLTRVGIFITDTYTTANAFVALTEGHLAIQEATYGPSLDTPGMHVVDGKHYGRNYGQLVLSLPAYWLLRGVSVLADLRIALVAAWSLLLLGFSMVLGRLLEYRRPFSIGGSLLALLLFLVNVALASPIPDAIVPVLAMQLTSVLAAAALAVVVYRLVGLLATPQAGVFAAVLTVLGTPISFWAPIPKRHVFTTLLTLLGIYWFARSRGHSDTHRVRSHGAAYAAVGVLAWIHAPEAMVMFAALLIADGLTLRRAQLRSLPTVGGVFLLSLLPFVVTNVLITGEPFLPPRLLKVVDASVTLTPLLLVGPLAGTAQPMTLPVVDDVVTAVWHFWSLLRRGLEQMIDHPDEVYRTFVRSGYVATNAAASEEAINLAVLESAPVLGAIVALPAAMARRLWDERPALDRLRQPLPATALAVGLYTVLFTLLYAERLPLHAQVTVRYLLPLYVLGVVAVALAPPVRRALAAHVRTFVWTVAAGTLLGGQAVVVYALTADLALGEAFQFHALLGLVVATVVAGSSLGSAATDRFDRALPVSLGLATAATAVFSLLVVTSYAEGLGVYPTDGGQLLPLLRLLAELLTIG